eukprot:5989128-Pyramimonas_sp.AAC.1
MPAAPPASTNLPRWRTKPESERRERVADAGAEQEQQARHRYLPRDGRARGRCRKGRKEEF